MKNQESRKVDVVFFYLGSYFRLPFPSDFTSESTQVGLQLRKV